MLEIRIAELRKEKKISQEQLAEVLNTSRQAVSKWERGESYPDLDRLKDLAIYFGVSIDYLLGYDVESTSINGFINRLENAIKNRNTGVSTSEIKIIVSKNVNNFNLLVASIKYLVRFWSILQDEEIPSLVRDCAERAILNYQNDNKYHTSINELRYYIIISYYMENKNESLIEYAKEHNVYGSDTFVADAYYELKEYEKASSIISDVFLESISVIINGNITQARILLQTKKLNEAYELACWSISFIESIEKKEDLFVVAVFIFTILKACIEKTFNLDYQKSISYLKDNYNKIINIEDNSENIKFYYNKKVDFYSLFKDMKTTFYKDVEKLKDDKDIYEASLYILNKVFEEDAK